MSFWLSQSPWLSESALEIYINFSFVFLGLTLSVDRFPCISTIIFVLVRTFALFYLRGEKLSSVLSVLLQFHHSFQVYFGTAQGHE